MKNYKDITLFAFFIHLFFIMGCHLKNETLRNDVDTNFKKWLEISKNYLIKQKSIENDTIVNTILSNEIGYLNNSQTKLQLPNARYDILYDIFKNKYVSYPFFIIEYTAEGEKINHSFFLLKNIDNKTEISLFQTLPKVEIVKSKEINLTKCQLNEIITSNHFKINEQVVNYRTTYSITKFDRNEISINYFYFPYIAKNDLIYRMISEF